MGTYAYFSKTKLVDMRHILLFLTIAFGLTVNAQDLAIITFDSLTIDYGTVVKSENGIRQFKFTNTGTSDLNITQVRSSCGCTIPKKPSKSNACQIGLDGSTTTKHNRPPNNIIFIKR